MSEDLQKVKIKAGGNAGHHGPPGSALGRPVEKAKNFRGTVKRLLRYLRPQAPRLIIVLILAVGSTIFTVRAPKISGDAINQLTDGFLAKQTVSGAEKGQANMVPKINSMLKTMQDTEDKTISQTNSTIKAKFSDTINTKKQAAYAQAIQKTDAAVEQAFNSTMSAQKQAAYTQAIQKADAAAKAGVDANFAKMMPGLKDYSKIPGYNNILAQEKATAEAKAKAMVDAGFAANKATVDSKLAAAKLSAEAKAKAAVDDAFAKQQATMDAQLQKTINDTDAKIKSEFNKQALKKSGLTQSQFDTMKDMVKLPVIKDMTDKNKMADTIKKLSDLSEKMPAQYQNSKYKISKTEKDKGIEAVRKYGRSIPFNVIWNTLAFLLLIYVLSSLLTFVMQFVMSGVAQKTVYALRKEVDDKLARLPLKYYDGHSNGDILSRMTNDIDTVSQTLQQSLTQLITSILMLIGYIWMMCTISVTLTLIVIATLPLYIFATMFIAKHSQKYYAAQQKHLGSLSAHTEEMFTGHVIVKAFGHEKDSIKTFEAVNDDLYKEGWKAQFLSGVMMPVMNFISNIGYVLIAVVGGIFVTKSFIGLGDITAFISYSKSFSMPIIQTANIANIIQSTVACAERVFEMLDEDEEEPESEDAVTLAKPEGNIRFDHVKFGYSDDRILMQDMNLDIKQGETIAIVGPTGAGKTTLVNLLMRFYEIQGGEITFDGVNIRRMTRGGLRTMFGMVLQDTWLFNGTIRDNIAYGREGATEDDIIQASKAAHADHFIRSLPDGYNTVLNEEASNISQGQKQLLTIARAILADPSVLILDEATSSVDTRTEVLIQKAMARLMKGRTNFVIAHRLSTIRDAEMILVMKHGTIIETGNHNELMEKHGFYADLYNSQFTGASLTEFAEA